MMQIEPNLLKPITMKVKFFITLIIAGIAIVGCTSNKNADGELDSNRVDTSQTSSVTSTDTTVTDTTTKAPDTIPVDRKN